MTRVAFLVAALVTVLTTPLVRRLAVRCGLVDRPGPLKIHAHAVPYLGGLAVVAGVFVGSLGVRVALLIPVAMALVLGLADDARDLSPRVRLAAEVLIGATAAAVLHVALPGALLAVASVVVLINAVNLLDGMDGLASGVALVSVAGFAAVLDGQPRTLALAIAGAVTGFLVFNRPPASIYLGDSGAYALGTLLAMLLISASTTGQSHRALAAGIALVAVPVADTTVAVLRRWRAGEPLLRGDRGHVYDQLVDRGLAPGHATCLCIGAQALLAAAAVGAALMANPLSLALLAVLIAALAGGLVAAGFLSPDYARSNP